MPEIWVDVVEIVVSRRQLFVGHSRDGLVFLGLRPPERLAPTVREEQCLQGNVPWCHVSLATFDNETVASRIAGKLQHRLPRLLGPRGHLHLYLHPKKGLHGDVHQDLGTRCSLNYAVCLAGLKALAQVLRGLLLVFAAEASARPWNIGRELHVSVLNLLCVDWRRISIGHVPMNQDLGNEDYELDFRKTPSFHESKGGDHGHILKEAWDEYLFRDCVLKRAREVSNVPRGSEL